MSALEMAAACFGAALAARPQIGSVVYGEVVMRISPLQTLRHVLKHLSPANTERAGLGGVADNCDAHC